AHGAQRVWSRVRRAAGCVTSAWPHLPPSRVGGSLTRRRADVNRRGTLPVLAAICGATDTVTISRAEWESGRLRVAASSSGSGATLKEGRRAAPSAADDGRSRG